MKNTVYKIIKTLTSYLIIAVFLIYPYLPIIDNYSQAKAFEILDEDIVDGGVAPTDTTEDDLPEAPTDFEIDEGGAEIEFGKKPANYVYEPDVYQPEYPSDVGQQRFNSERVVLNATDRRDLDNTLLLNSVIPNLYTDLEELSTLTGHSVDRLISYRDSDGEKFSKAVLEAKNKIDDSYIKERLLNDYAKLAEFLRISQSSVIYEINNNIEAIEGEIDEAQNSKIDKKVIATLAYLVRPKDDPRGGAGHWKIKVYRLRRNYTRENTKFSRESFEAEEDEATKKEKEDQTIESYKSETESSEVNELLNNSGLNESEVLVAGEIQSSESKIDQQISDFILVDDESSATISAHYKGQAIDISEVDDFKCTLIQKKRLGSDKKTANPPKPLKLQWQTSEGYGADQDAIDSSYNDMLVSMSEDAIVEMLSSMNIDFSELGDMEYANFGDIISIIGQAFLANSINAPNGEIWKFDLPGVLRGLGGVIVADNLNLDREPFLDPSLNSVDDLSQAVGRYAIEKRLNLPYGALNGTDRDEIFTQTGMSRIAYELGLPYDIFKYEMTNEDQVHQAVGSRIVEENLGLQFGSFFGKQNLKDIEDSTGKYKLKGLLSFPKSIDSLLEIPDGTTAQLKSGSMNPSKFNEIVARSHFVSIAYNYPKLNDGGGNENLRDEMFNLPEGTIDRFLTGALSVEDLKSAGYRAVAEGLETSDTLRASLEDFLRNPNIYFTAKKYKIDNGSIVEVSGEIQELSEGKYASTLGIDMNDVQSIFVSKSTNDALGIYNRLGERILSEAVRNSSAIERGVNDLKNRIPAVADVLDTYEFYFDRVEEIKKRSASFKSRSSELRAAVDAINDPSVEALARQMSISVAELEKSLDLLENSNISASNIYSVIETIVVETSSTSNRMTYELGAIANATEVRANGQIVSLINALNRDVEVIAKASYEIITGETQNGFRIEDLNLSNMMSGTTGELVLLLSGKIDVKDFLIYHASAKLGTELNLPPLAFKYAAAIMESVVKDDVDIKDAFYRAFGMASLEEKAGIGSTGQILDDKEMGFAVTINQIRDGLVKNAKMTTDNANQVILEALNLQGFSFNSLTHGDFGAWATAREKAKQNDVKNKMPIGTTEAFVKSEPLGKYDEASVESDEIRELATKLGISEAALETFVAVRDGAENPSINKIYYVDNNRYIEHQDTSGQCASKPSPDDSYYYFDQDGQHVFSSYAAANEFRIANPDKEVDYLEETKSAIIKAVDDWTNSSGSLLQDGSNPKIDIDKKISDFLNNNSQAKFDNYDSLLLVFEAKGISSLSTDSVFSRAVSSNNEVPIDFLKIYGYSIIEHFAISYMNDYLGISFGRAKLTPGDFFDLFNGRAEEVFGKVGGAMMDEELGLRRGSMEEIITASNSDQRRCAMERAAMQILGDVLGIHGLNLQGSIYDNFGGGKIESFLALPDKSFNGANLSELISRIGKTNFIRAFKVPVPSETEEFLGNFMESQLGSEYYSANRSKNVSDKIAGIELYLQALDSDPSVEVRSQIRDAWKKIDGYLDKAIGTLAASSSSPLWSDTNNNTEIENYNKNLNDNKNTYSEEEFRSIFRSFISRQNTLDNAFGINSGTTQRLLTGLISPDKYREEVSDTAIESIAIDALINVLGLDNTGINSVRVNELKNALKFLKTGDLFDQFANSTPAAVIYEFLDDLFSFNLDKKAGFSYGTIEKILTHPDRALPVILREGAILLDRQLGLGGNANAYGGDIGPGLLRYLSLSTIVDYAYGTEADYSLCLALDYDNNSTYSSHKDCMDKRRNVKYKSAVKQNATNAINRFLLDETGVRLETRGANGQIILSDKRHGIDMPINEISKIFDGDMRPFYVFSMAYGIGSILGDENGTMRINEELAFEYMDIYYAFYGDPDVEDAARRRAENRIYAINNADPEVTPLDGFLPITDPSPALPRGSTITTIRNSRHQTRTAPTVSALVESNIDSKYNIPTGSNTSAPAVSSFTQLPPDQNDQKYIANGVFDDSKYGDDYNNYMQSYSNWHQENTDANLIRQEAKTAGEEAQREARKMFVEQFKYRTSDCLLAKLDPRLPAGFSWAMWNGDEYVRTAFVLQYIENWIKDAGFFDSLPQEFRDLNLLVPLQNFIAGPNEGDWGVLLGTSGMLTSLDRFMVHNSPEIMGMTIEPGTVGAIYSWIQSGDSGTPATILGNEMPTLQSVYGTNWVIGRISSWADRKLGLPSGTMYQFYSFYDQYSAITNLSSVLSKFDAGTKGISEVAKFDNFGAGIIEGYGKYVAGLGEGEVADSLKEWAKPRLDNMKADLYAALISFVIDLAFSKQIASLEQSLGLVPGSGTLLVTMAVNVLLGVAVTVPLVMFVALNLFGVYRVIYSCTPDGYYPAIEDPPDPNKWDSSSGVGTFNAMNPKIREQKYIESAQYKANRLVGDLYEMPYRTGNESLVPTQVMTGRSEDVITWAPYLDDTVCKKVGGGTALDDGICDGTKAGLWQNPQMSSYTHIGF